MARQKPTNVHSPIDYEDKTQDNVHLIIENAFITIAVAAKSYCIVLRK